MCDLFKHKSSKDLEEMIQTLANDEELQLNSSVFKPIGVKQALKLFSDIDSEKSRSLNKLISHFQRPRSIFGEEKSTSGLKKWSKIELKEQYGLIQKPFEIFLNEFKKQTRALASHQIKHIRTHPEYTVMPVHKNIDLKFLESMHVNPSAQQIDWKYEGDIPLI